MLSRKRVLLAKIEANEGVAETLSATDNPLLVKDLKIKPEVRVYERAILNPTLSKLPPIPAGATATVSFSVELKGKGTAYSATNKPEIGEYLKACGFSETVDTTTGAEKVVYEPASEGVPSMTLGVYLDGIVLTVAGARGNVRFSGKVGEPVIAEFEFKGVWLGAQDTPLPTPAYDISNPPVCIAGSVQIDTYNPVITAFSFDMGNSVEMRESIAAQNGYISALITARDPKGSFDPELTPVSTYDWFNKWRNGETASLSVQIGSSQYNRVKFNAPNIVFTDISEEDRNGILSATVDFALAMQSGDDELVITFD